MTRIAWEIKQRFSQPFTLGINVLRNDAQAAIAIAKAVHADFVRINVHIGAAWTDQGLIEGSAYENLMYRRSIASQVQIASDVLVKHAAPAGSSELLLLAKDSVLRGGADILILTGTRTGTTTTTTENKNNTNNDSTNTNTNAPTISNEDSNTNATLQAK